MTRQVLEATHFIAIATALALAACTETEPAGTASDTARPETPTETGSATNEMNANPFFSQSPLYLQYPPFDRIETQHYVPAFEAGMSEQLAEVEAITTQSGPPTIENTLIELERSGRLLERVSNVFFSMSSAHTNDAIQDIEAEMAPKLSAHRDSILLNDALFERIDRLYRERGSLDLDPETLRLVEETHRDFVRAGALLTEPEKERLRAINSELAELSTEFDRNVLAERNELAIVVDTREELAGLTDTEIESAADAAAEQGLDGKFVLPLLNTTQQPPLASLENRALRQRILEASLSRGSRGGEYDNREILSRTARLRAERARLLGYHTHPH
jgi:peptidyl-dipeptidase Dcp